MENDERIPPTPPVTTKAEDAVVSPETAAKIGVLFGEALEPLKALRETTEKSHTAYLAYMDRLILLAGGTLTLTFSAIATISGHLADLGINAAHPRFVVAECWLLVTCIVFGLASSQIRILLRQQHDQQTILAETNLFIKMKIIALTPTVDLEKLPDLKSDEVSERTGRLKTWSRVFSGIVHLSLAAAFVCLAVFIQGNIVSLLTAAVKR